MAGQTGPQAAQQLVNTIERSPIARAVKTGQRLYQRFDKPIRWPWSQRGSQQRTGAGSGRTGAGSGSSSSRGNASRGNPSSPGTPSAADRVAYANQSFRDAAERRKHRDSKLKRSERKGPGRQKKLRHTARKTARRSGGR